MVRLVARGFALIPSPTLQTLPCLRWERIATVVEGKSKAQCFKRFKELKDAFKAKKTEA